MMEPTDGPAFWQRPPGPPLYLATAIAVALVLGLASAPELMWLMLTFLVLLVVGLTWLARWVVGFRPRRLGWRAAAQWFGVPAALGAAVLLAFNDVPMRVRFELSRDDMERFADEAADRPWATSVRVGLFEVDFADVLDGSVRLEIGTASWDLFGFERFDDRDITEHQVERRCHCDSMSLGDGWWTYTEDF